MLSAEFTQLDYSSGENGEYLSYELFFEGKESGDWQNYVDSISEINDIYQLYNTHGRGVSLSFEFKDTISDGTFSLLIEDLGFIRWSENTSHHDISDVLHPLKLVISITLTRIITGQIRFSGKFNRSLCQRISHVITCPIYSDFLKTAKS